MAYSAGGESSSSSGTSDSTPPWKYDVFLSFAGQDTRLNFTGHLDAAFTRSGIKTFRDDVDLEKGEDIKQGLFQAIKYSLCAVLIISENYAESSWCLDELQKILESRKTLRRRVIPIFYDVNPSDVKHLRGSFGEALAKHEKNKEKAENWRNILSLIGRICFGEGLAKHEKNKEKVENWRNVLSQIGSISGEDTRGRHEAELIKKIVGDVWSYLSSKLPYNDDNLVGIDSRVADLMPFLQVGLDDKRSVGIWGMGGLGKTTLARVVSKILSHKFEICCFLANVRETLLQTEGLVSLQKRLLSHLKIQNMEIHDSHEGKEMLRKYFHEKKVLLVLDDVHDVSQLNNLVESPDWFGKGSRIIITTRDRHLLTASRVERIYEMKPMKKDESLQLFSKKAFRKDYPEDNYLELSESVVKYAGGLPLALEVLGSFLCGRSEAEWRDALDRLKQTPDDDRILQALKISYDGLKNENDKTIFLDIACFFKGWRKEEVIRILKSCDLNPTIGIEVLIERSLLVETQFCTLEMHDLLKDLGRYIVHQESPNDVGKRSRLWKSKDIKEVLENNMGCEKIQAIVMRSDYCRDRNEIKVHPEAFSKMSNIRSLILNENYYSPLILPRGSKLWSGIQVMNKLTFIDLARSQNLTETIDFSRVPYLQHLHLCDCESLVTIHPSLGKLKNLVKVDLSYCKNLQVLPEKLETNSLMKLDLTWCKKVKVLPEFGEGMEKLSCLGVKGTAITRLPDSLVFLTGLGDLNLEGHKILNLEKLLKIRITRQISGLSVMCVTELRLRNCGLNDGSIVDYFSSLSSLIVLDLSLNDFVNLPIDGFSSLYRLLFLSLDCCKRLKSLPRLPPRLIRLDAGGCDSMEPLSEGQLCNLVYSLDHEYRGRTKYVNSDKEDDDIQWELDDVELESLPLRDFVAMIPGSDIPSWFTNKDYSPYIRREDIWGEEEDIWEEEEEEEEDIRTEDILGEEEDIWEEEEEEDIRTEDILGEEEDIWEEEEEEDIRTEDILGEEEDIWEEEEEEDIRTEDIWGEEEDILGEDIWGEEEDNRYECEIKVNIPEYFRNSEWSGIVVCLLISNLCDLKIMWSSKAAEDDVAYHKFKSLSDQRQLCIMVLELNEETCWKHLTAHNNTLHIQLYAYDCICEILGCGWRVICKERFPHNQFNQLASPHESGINDGLILIGFGKLSSLTLLDLIGNDSVNLLTGCFSSLCQLAFLLLNDCKRLKPLSRLPPWLIRLGATGCNSMEPLSDEQLWNLVASFDHEYHGRTKYGIEKYVDIPSVSKQVEAESYPLRDF